MKSFVSAILCMFIVAFSKSVWSSETLRFVAEDLYPLHFTDDKKQPKGFLVELVDKVLSECQCQGRVEIMPQARAFKEFKSHKNTLMISLLKTPQRSNEFNFLGSVYFADAYLIGLKKKSFSLLDLKSAHGLRVSTVRGYFSHHYLEKSGFSTEHDLVLAPDPASLLHMLYKERTDLVLTNTLSLDEELKSIGLDPSQIEKKLSLPDFPNELHFVANKQLSPSLAQSLSQSLQRVKLSGEYEKLLKKWQLGQTNALNLSKNMN
ncbi:transporter substrate-binding domain-containing protein [Pseudoalteromonas phenolica]|uniref:Amino acid ABC transporter substrate-binding protein n=1 Tax=Pseudoalteromonas phenolica TaxID=161398 RepID=A0A0S2K398_9GAMM|nr:transporter substrate-binding domain-containing protein [Pseudoalteromonas phenolica]ALO42970.1 amino acid ABC transporter substrate-binding protein [Pseudoalteromonas phenolica]MBE0355887.1 polar amino acid transport system substrate-binding protein [Pseudoalteromonas phenolica O-BC30]